MNIQSVQPQVLDNAERALGKEFRIERYGLTWSGSWAVKNDNLVVTSTYGSRTIPVERAEDLDLAAQTIMSKIVVAWRQARAPTRDRRK